MRTNVMTYLKRLCLMLFVFLPTTLLAVALISADPAEFSSFGERILTVAFMFSVYGPVAASVASVSHTLLAHRLPTARPWTSVILGVALGAIVVLPLSLTPERAPTLFYGAIPGGLYGLVVDRFGPRVAATRG